MAIKDCMNMITWYRHASSMNICHLQVCIFLLKVNDAFSYNVFESNKEQKKR